MNIVLYKNSSEDNKVNKNIYGALNISGTLRGEMSIMNPVILLDNDNIYKYNYLYIKEFDRYYFIKNITTIRNGLFQISCVIDVLMSYSNGIYNLTAIVEKQESTRQTNMYLDDGSFVTLNKTFNDIKNFPSGFNESGEFILITAGG